MRSPGGGELSLSACPGVENRPPSKKKIANPRGCARGGMVTGRIEPCITLVGYQDSRQLLIGKFPYRVRLSIKRTHLRSLVVRFIIICNSYPLCRIQILVCPYACKRFYWIRWGNFINMTSELVNMTCIFMTELTGPTLQLYDYRGLFILFFCGLLAGPG